MALPKKIKNNLKIYPKKELIERRQEMLDEITKSDTFLPDPILHDDLDLGMLNYVKDRFKINSGNQPIPIIPRILTIQRWGEIAQSWSFMNDDNNIELPFIGVVRRPDVQPGTNPSLQRTIPNRKTFHYNTVPNWNGNIQGADVYKIPQPVPIDITYDISIVCTKLRDLNVFNRIVLQQFASRQSYTQVKGHYIPIILENINDKSPIDDIDGRKYYQQTYTLTMLGFIIDDEEFEVKPAINRAILMSEIMDTKKQKENIIQDNIELVKIHFIADGSTTCFYFNEPIGELLLVTINGVVQSEDNDYYHIGHSTKITFVLAPEDGLKIEAIYYKSKSAIIKDQDGIQVYVGNYSTIYNGNNIIDVGVEISSVLSLSINGLLEHDSYQITDSSEITLTSNPVNGSEIFVVFFYR